MPVSHSFVSAIPDSADTTIVRPANWNAGHVVDVDLAAEAHGILPIPHGGTGLDTLGAANKILSVNGAGNALAFTYATNQNLQTVDAVTFANFSGSSSGTNTGDQDLSGYLTISSAASNYQPLDSDLTALAGISTNGFFAHTGAGTAAARTITQGGGITVTNGDGVAGNPTLSIANLKTEWIPASAIRPSYTGGCAPLALLASGANQPDIQYLSFDSTAQEYAQFSIRFQKAWNLGTVTAVFIWSHAATTTNFGVKWGLQGVSIADNEAMAVAYGTAQEIADTGGTTDKQYISSATSAITIAGTPAAGEVQHFRLYRAPADAADTLAIDARLHGVLLFYSVNTLDDA